MSSKYRPVLHFCQLPVLVCLPRLREFSNSLSPRERQMTQIGSCSAGARSTLPRKILVLAQVLSTGWTLVGADPSLLVGQLHVLETKPLRVVLGLAAPAWHRTALGGESQHQPHQHNHTPRSVYQTRRGQALTAAAWSRQHSVRTGGQVPAAGSQLLLHQSPKVQIRGTHSRSRRIFTNGLPIVGA